MGCLQCKDTGLVEVGGNIIDACPNCDEGKEVESIFNELEKLIKKHKEENDGY